MWELWACLLICWLWGLAQCGLGTQVLSARVLSQRIRFFSATVPSSGSYTCHSKWLSQRSRSETFWRSQKCSQSYFPPKASRFRLSSSMHDGWNTNILVSALYNYSKWTRVFHFNVPCPAWRHSVQQADPFFRSCHIYLWTVTAACLYHPRLIKTVVKVLMQTRLSMQVRRERLHSTT